MSINKMPVMDGRSAKDILDHMMRLAENYTPEWRFDAENPDIGAALAIIYANMFNGTVKRFNRTAQKNIISFFNSIGAYIQPAAVARGYVYFKLSTENYNRGIQVDKGISLIAGSTVRFQTMEEVLVTNSYIQNIFLTNGREDVMTNVFDRESGVNEIDIFNLQNENFQKHEVYIFDRIILNIKGHAEIDIEFITADKNNGGSDSQIRKLIEQKKITVEYFTQDGFAEFNDIIVDGHRIIAVKQERSEAPAIYDNNAYAVRLRIKNNDVLKNRTYSSVRLSSKSDKIMPDGILSEGGEQRISEFYAFTEKPSSYMELYFSSEEVFSKKGALVTISFFLDFREIQLENPEQQIQWKMIIRRSDVEPEQEYDISVAGVIWEYFNGYGWSRLFEDNSYSDIFDHANMRHTKSITFVCPDDIEKTVIESMNSYFIRVRVVKMNNEFKLRGKYLAPLIQNISLSYNYMTGIAPYMMKIYNNTECETYVQRDFLSDDLDLKLYRYMDSGNSTVYLGLKNPPVSGPVKYLFALKEEQSQAMPMLEWEYLSENGWKNINMVDETENLRKTGIITFMSGNDYALKKMFGTERFWIRVTDVMDAYDINGQFYKKRPVIENIFLNAVHVINVSEKETELFEIIPFESNKICRLRTNMQYDIRVMVNEINERSADQLKALEAMEKAELVYDVYGTMIYAWVEWEEVRNFSLSSSESRHYTADRNEGKIMFGNGINGHIPVHEPSKTIKVEYNCGGGSDGNIAAGMLNKSAQSLGIVSFVTNPFAMYAGTDIEKVDDALTRSMSMFRCFGRGVTTDDYEALAIKADRNILRTKCISGINQSGEYSCGCTVLVILIRDYAEKNNSFFSVRENLLSIISQKVSSIVISENKFFIRAPEFIEYCVSAELVIKNLNNVFDIRSRAMKKINEFLDPISGNFDGSGWDIGCTANEHQILNVLSSVKGMEYVKKVSIRYYTDTANQRQEIMRSDFADSKYVLALNGEHEIIITTQ